MIVLSIFFYMLGSKQSQQQYELRILAGKLFLINLSHCKCVTQTHNRLMLRSGKAVLKKATYTWLTLSKSTAMNGSKAACHKIPKIQVKFVLSTIRFLRL